MSSYDPVEKHPLIQHIQYGAKWTQLEMAASGRNDLFRSLLPLDLLHRSGDLWTGSAPMEGKGASKSRSRGQQGCIC